MDLFRRFSRTLNRAFPAKEALAHVGDYQTLVEINVLAARQLRDGRLSMKGIPPKLRAIADAFLGVARGRRQGGADFDFGQRIQEGSQKAQAHKEPKS